MATRGDVIRLLTGHGGNLLSRLSKEGLQAFHAEMAELGSGSHDNLIDERAQETPLSPDEERVFQLLNKTLQALLAPPDR